MAADSQQDSCCYCIPFTRFPIAATAIRRKHGRLFSQPVSLHPTIRKPIDHTSSSVLCDVANDRCYWATLGKLHEADQHRSHNAEILCHRKEELGRDGHRVAATAVPYMTSLGLTSELLRRLREDMRKLPLKLMVSKSYVDEELAKLSGVLQAELAAVKSQIKILQFQTSNGNNVDGGGPLVSRQEALLKPQSRGSRDGLSFFRGYPIHPCARSSFQRDSMIFGV